MSEPTWNYESSQEQTKAEFAQMYKELTDPEERRKLKLGQDRESYAQDKVDDYGLGESDSA